MVPRYMEEMGYAYLKVTINEGGGGGAFWF